MKVVIPWVCVFGLAIGCFFLYATAKEDEKQLASVPLKDAELFRLRADNQEVQQLKTDHAELVRLRNDQEELLRLRGEVGQLRKQVKQLGAELQTARTLSSAAMQQQHKSTELSTENEALRNQNLQLQQKQAQVNAAVCIRNLNVIAAAKELWANDTHKAQGALPTFADLMPYLPNNTFPSCPDGGAYTVNAIGFPPTCNIPGHSLPKP
jgi:hypothetical protein